MTYLIERPGLLFVIATLLPLAGATILLLANGLRSLARANREPGVVAVGTGEAA